MPSSDRMSSVALRLLCAAENHRRVGAADQVDRDKLAFGVAKQLDEMGQVAHRRAVDMGHDAVTSRDDSPCDVLCGSSP